MTDWLPIGNVATVIMGQAPPGDTYNTIGEGLPFFQGKAEFRKESPVAVKWCSAPSRIAEPGDILLSVRAPVGPTNVATERCCIGRGLAAIRPKDGRVTGRYLLHFLRRFELDLAQRGVGSTFTAINRKDIEQFRIPVPPLAEQEQVVNVLDQADRLRQLRATAEERTSQLTQAIFLEMFGNPAAPSRQWPQASLDEITTLITSGSTPRGGSQVYASEGPYFIRSQNVLMNKLDLSDAVCLPRDVHKQMSRTVVHRGDVLLNITGASIGRVAWVDKLDREANVNQHVCIIRLKQTLALPEYISACLSLPWYQATINQIQAGASRQALNHQQVRKFQLILPPLNSQRVFADCMAQIEALRKSQFQSRKLLDQLFESLMARVFAGKLMPEESRIHAKPIEEEREIRLRFPRRQQVILALLNEQLGRGRNGVTRTQMMKYSFLTQKRGGRKAGVNRLYQFHPYHYGPFDKKVYADVETLSKGGLIQTEKRPKITKPGDEFTLIRLTPEGTQIANGVTSQLDPKLRETIKSVITEFGRLTHDQLLKHVYQLYPRYATKSVKRNLVKK